MLFVWTRDGLWDIEGGGQAYGEVPHECRMPGAVPAFVGALVRLTPSDIDANFCVVLTNAFAALPLSTDVSKSQCGVHTTI